MKKHFFFDLDGTITESKTPVSGIMRMLFLGQPKS